ncbi:unnamed protein product [Trifolium pratense]|uniref:Uncharacterized protein n=1 Tax=Trifolium pratense TaxID=57577 RepID=A0ACB0KET9_TRIPR|nr:unnamed protein product [Trifolium pratense]
MSSERTGQGRKKIVIKKMTNEIHLQVTFSKRRSGLFKKASELCTLCGADAALIVFSPTKKVFSFGHPNVDTVIDRYLSLVPPQNNRTMELIEAQRCANVRELNAQLTMLNNTLDLEKRRSDELNHMLKMNQAQYWWACPIDGMNKVQLEIFKKSLEDLKILVAQQAQRAQFFETQFFQNPLFHPELFGFDNMGGQGGYGPSGFF